MHTWRVSGDVWKSHVANRFFLTPRTNAHGMLKWIPSSRADGGAIQLLWDFTTTLKRESCGTVAAAPASPFAQPRTSKYVPVGCCQPGCSAVQEKRVSITPTVTHASLMQRASACAHEERSRSGGCSVSR